MSSVPIPHPLEDPRPVPLRHVGPRGRDRRRKARRRYEWQSLHGTLDGVRILVVDDNEDHLDIITAFLQRLGATVLNALGASGALLQIREFKPDVVLADLMMPRIDGFKLLAEIKQLRLDDGGRIPVVAVSGHYDAKTAVDSGFRGFVPKPVDLQQLTETILDVLPERGTR
jgi:CheY-like chemotaxis protein